MSRVQSVFFVLSTRLCLSVDLYQWCSREGVCEDVPPQHQNLIVDQGDEAGNQFVDGFVGAFGWLGSRVFEQVVVSLALTTLIFLHRRIYDWAERRYRRERNNVAQRQIEAPPEMVIMEYYEEEQDENDV